MSAWTRKKKNCLLACAKSFVFRAMASEKGNDYPGPSKQIKLSDPDNDGEKTGMLVPHAKYCLNLVKILKNLDYEKVIYLKIYFDLYKNVASQVAPCYRIHSVENDLGL